VLAALDAAVGAGSQPEPEPVSVPGEQRADDER
jgi:hypothetical protein